MAETVLIDAESSNGPIEYSVWQDGSILKDWQTDNSFELDTGEYVIKCRDRIGCVAEKDYVLSNYPLPVKTSSENIVHIVEDEDAGEIYIKSYDGSLTETNEETLSTDTYDNTEKAPIVLPDGSCFVTFSLTDNTNASVIRKHDDNGNLVNETILPDDGYAQGAFLDPSTGELVTWTSSFAGDSNIARFNPDGTLEGEYNLSIEPSSEVFLGLPDGRYAIIDSDFGDESIKIMDRDFNILGSIAGETGGDHAIPDTNGKDIYQLEGSNVHKYDTHNFSLIGTADVGAQLSSFTQGMAVDQTHIFAFSYTEIAIFDTDLNFVKTIDVADISDHALINGENSMRPSTHNYITTQDNDVVHVSYKDSSEADIVVLSINISDETIIHEVVHEGMENATIDSDYFHTENNPPS